MIFAISAYRIFKCEKQNWIKILALQLAVLTSKFKKYTLMYFRTFTKIQF